MQQPQLWKVCTYLPRPIVPSDRILCLSPCLVGPDLWGKLSAYCERTFIYIFQKNGVYTMVQTEDTIELEATSTDACNTFTVPSGFSIEIAVNVTNNYTENLKSVSLEQSVDV